MKTFMQDKDYSTTEKKLSMLLETASLIGYIPISKVIDNQICIQFTIYNCPYEEHLKQYQEVICQLHEYYLRGQMDVLFGNNEFVQYEKMDSACQFCHYNIRTNL